MFLFFHSQANFFIPSYGHATNTRLPLHHSTFTSHRNDKLHLASKLSYDCMLQFLLVYASSGILWSHLFKNRVYSTRCSDEASRQLKLWRMQLALRINLSYVCQGYFCISTSTSIRTVLCVHKESFSTVILLYLSQKGYFPTSHNFRPTTNIKCQPSAFAINKPFFNRSLTREAVSQKNTSSRLLKFLPQLSEEEFSSRRP